MLTGELPGQRIEPPSKKVQIDVRLDEVVLRALEKKPELRYQQASDLKTKVETIANTPSNAHASTACSHWANQGVDYLKSVIPIWKVLGVLALLMLAFWVWWAFRAGMARKAAMEARMHVLAATSNGQAKQVSATTARQGDIGVRLNTLGTVESSNSVMFAIDQRYCQTVIRRFDAHQALTVEASTGHGEKFGHGILSRVDNLIDTTTGTLKCKATLFPEGENLTVPGLFLNISLLLEMKHGVTLVPTADIQRDPQSAFVWVIQSDQTVERRTVRVGTIDGNWAEIQSGLSPGEVVVSSRFNSLGEGQKVRFDLASNAESAQAAGQDAAKGIEWLKIQSLAGWISDLQNPDQKVRKMAETAMMDMGTNSLPEILKVLNETNVSPSEGDTRRFFTAQALKFIGPGLKSSLPAFVALLQSSQRVSANAGAEALASSAPVVPEAFSILTNSLMDSPEAVRDAASHGIGLCLNTESNSFAETALPLLVRNLKDKDDGVRLAAANALMMYAQHQSCHLPPLDAKPDLLIPPLVKLLKDKYSYVRETAAYALVDGCFRDGIKPWIPAIQKLLSDPDAGVRQSAAGLLQRLNMPHVTNVIQNAGMIPAFSVQASGTGSLSYQWILGSNKAAGATNAVPK
jgi:hypothetical protein